MSYKVDLPLMPDPKDFTDREKMMYLAALATWERVCKQIIEKSTHNN